MIPDDYKIETFSKTFHKYDWYCVEKLVWLLSQQKSYNTQKFTHWQKLEQYSVHYNVYALYYTHIGLYRDTGCLMFNDYTGS